MPSQTILQKFEILADVAKYDASCASSGTAKKNLPGRPKGRGGLGSIEDGSELWVTARLVELAA